MCYWCFVAAAVALIVVGVVVVVVLFVHFRYVFCRCDDSCSTIMSGYSYSPYSPP